MTRSARPDAPTATAPPPSAAQGIVAHAERIAALTEIAALEESRGKTKHAGELRRTVRALEGDLHALEANALGALGAHTLATVALVESAELADELVASGVPRADLCHVLTQAADVLRGALRALRKGAARA